VPGNRICIKAIMKSLLQFECSLPVERITYFLKNSAVLFVVLFSKMLALKTEEHLASPLCCALSPKFLSRFNLN
jgi:hypothetical protein